MKKSVHLLFIFLMTASAAYSQITIQADDINPIGVVAYQTRDTMPDASIQPGGTGQQTWDFTNLKDQGTNVFTFLETGETPYADQFPQANLAAVVGDTFLYFNKSNDELSALGSYGTFTYSGFLITAKLALDPMQTILRFPSTMGDSYTDTYGQFVQVPNFVPSAPFDSLRAITHSNRTVVVDAFGEMTTQLGTYQTLRFKETIITVDSTFGQQNGIWFPILDGGPDTVINYNWWTNENNLAFPIVQYNIDLNDNDVEVLWLKDFVSETTELTPELTFSLHPNPTQGNLYLQLDKPMNGSVEIIDFNGKSIQSVNLNGTSVELDLRGSAPGIYIAILKSEAEGIVGFRKFEVLR